MVHSYLHSSVTHDCTIENLKCILLQLKLKQRDTVRRKSYASARTVGSMDLPWISVKPDASAASPVWGLTLSSKSISLLWRYRCKKCKMLTVWLYNKVIELLNVTMLDHNARDQSSIPRSARNILYVSCLHCTHRRFILGLNVSNLIKSNKKTVKHHFIHASIIVRY